MSPRHNLKRFACGKVQQRPCPPTKARIRGTRDKRVELF